MFRMPTRARLLVLLAALAGALALPPAAGALTVGIADNKPDMFFDARFERSGVRHARLAVGWDALSSPWQAEELYFFTAGRGRLRVGDEERDVSAGDCAVIPPGTVHKLWNTGSDPLVLLCCCAPAYSDDDTELVEHAP